MVSKKILGVAIAAAMSAPAFAVIDMTGGTGGAGAGAVVYAKEAITTGQVTDGMVQLTAAGTELNTVADLGFGVSAGSHAFVRFNLTNAKFKTAVVAADLTLPGQTVTTNYIVTVAQGGAVGDNYVIFDVTAVTAQTQTQDVQLALAGLQVSPTAATTISYAHYSTSPNAVGQTGALATDSYAGISVAEVLVPTVVATDRVADVTTTPAFTAFVNPASATAQLGTVEFKLTAGSLTAVGAPVTALNQVINVADGQSSMTVAGDLSFTTDANAAATAGNLTFGGSASDTAATNVPSGKHSRFTTAALAVNTAYAIAVTAKSAINAGAYSLSTNLVGIANAAYGPTNKTASLGTITRSGTTVQVPYVTTFGDYNQRLVLVNRSNLDAPYSITFTPEAGVTATAKAVASGTLAKGKTLILKATDVVEITGGSRTAATIVVTAPNTTIDAATTSVNLSDKSTDTVKLN
ncbi:hypothetical protein [Cellvibrio sp. pealriver]|uniref:hypothetical protein n=1 Tax=Cellvibrio sp. pealriver TaxID=1622269 RepID=UPI00066FB4F7|nr:hypothetical protein [Cellvibrio sp. pealriver]